MPAVMNTMWTPFEMTLQGPSSASSAESAADLRLAAGAQLPCVMVRPELDAPVRARPHELLRVGIGHDEFHALAGSSAIMLSTALVPPPAYADDA